MSEVKTVERYSRYKTAFCKVWGVFVRLDSVKLHCDEHDNSVCLVFHCSGTDRNGDKFRDWTMTDRELTDFCL